MRKITNNISKISLQIIRDYLDLVNTEDYTEMNYDENIEPGKSPQQQERDIQITMLLTAYVKSYEKKSKQNPVYRGVIVAIIFMIIIGITFASVFISIKFANKSNAEIKDIIGLVTSLAAFLPSIFGLFKLIIKYVFPAEEEKYITDIVKIIQENDLKNRQETNAYYDRHWQDVTQNINWNKGPNNNGPKVIVDDSSLSELFVDADMLSGSKEHTPMQ